ncbi:MAG: carbohydrate ABC transporter permease [Anaerolineae bacterium]|nr:carbohydrate ABC transporter permease [Anaerolineae bacterium]
MRINWQRLIVYCLLILISFIFFFPFLFLLSTSLKTGQQIFAVPLNLVPNPIAWDNYPQAIEFIPFLKYFGNSVWITFWNILFTVISSSLVAYGFSRIQWYGRDVVFGLVIATLMIPLTVVLIPQFLIFRNLGWVGTQNPLIIPALAGHPFFIFLLRQFYRTIPFELSEAARIDGASEFGIFWRIILPLTRPALVTVGLFTFLWNWNDFFGPMIYLNKDENFTLAVGLYQYFSTRGNSEWGLLMAAAAIMIAPVIVLFFFAQRTFIKGISVTGLKG